MIRLDCIQINMEVAYNIKLVRERQKDSHNVVFEGPRTIEEAV